MDASKMAYCSGRAGLNNQGWQCTQKCVAIDVSACVISHLDLLKLAGWTGDD